MTMRLVTLLLDSISVAMAASPSPTPPPSPSPSPTPGFEAGAVCANYTTFRSTKHLALSGKHLVIGEVVYPRWGIDWSGIDITLLDRVAAILNFTYQIKRVAWDKQGNAANATEHTDLVLNYWTATPENVLSDKIIRGHVDTSRYLVTYKPTVKQESLMDHWETMFKPFTYGLWGTVFGMMVCSGLLMYILERGSDTDDFDKEHQWFHSQFLSFGMIAG